MFSRLGASQEEIVRLSYDVLYRPFSGRGKQKAVFVQNLANSSHECMYRKDGSVLQAYNTPGPVSSQLLKTFDNNDTRWCAPTGGNTFIRGRSSNEHSTALTMLEQNLLAARRSGWLGEAEIDALLGFHPVAADYVLYLLASGILPREDLANLIPVSSFTDFNELLLTLKTAGRAAMPYNPRPDFFALCRRYGVAGVGGISPTVAALYDKHNFRELVEALRPGTFRYSRLWCRAGESPDVTSLRLLVAESRQMQPIEIEPKVLFIQKTWAAGGHGNFAVKAHSNGGFSIGNTSHKRVTLHEVAQFIADLQASVEVTPFLPLEASPSFGIIVAKQGVAVLGPFQQLLNAAQDYSGFVLNRPGSFTGYTSEVAEFLQDNGDRIRELCAELGELQRSKGYIGYIGIDTMIYRDHRGRLQVSYAEENQRFTATCMMQMLIHRRPRWQELFSAGELSCLEDDHVPLAPQVLATTETLATNTAHLLRSHGVPVVDDHTPFGIILMARPCTLTQSASIGVVAPNDELRDTWYAAAVRVLSGQMALIPSWTPHDVPRRVFV